MLNKKVSFKMFPKVCRV